jgi:hypothetical protein
MSRFFPYALSIIGLYCLPVVSSGETWLPKMNSPQTRRAAALGLSGKLFLLSRLPDQRDVLARPTSETEDGLSLGTFGLASGDRIASGSKMVASQPRVSSLMPRITDLP